MPCLTLSSMASGPLITVQVGVSDPRRVALQAAKQAVPPPVEATFLVDTGASMSAVDGSLMLALALKPTGKLMGHTPSTNGQATSFLQYDVMLHLRGSSPGQGWQIGALAVMASSFVAQNIQGLIGRDILDRGILIYNGPTNHFTLAY